MKRQNILKDFFKSGETCFPLPPFAFLLQRINTPVYRLFAGITMATAILSAITEIPVRADVAMTGEITLRGRVLPIGGLKEKLMAAKNAGMHRVLVPEKNRVDVQEISGEIKKGLDIRFMENMDEVLELALCSQK